MPLYEYVCQSCGERFEKLIRSIIAPPEIVCPSCASVAVKRALSTFATRGGDADRAAPACGPVG
ncbi:MAG: zinc ribbon domain-containing protein [Kouleothrix sp.]|nr:zinc ribbon domain-containing protein [Kouleothrix sp.]